MARKTDRFQLSGPNPLWQVYKTVPFLKVVFQFAVIQTGRYLPFMPLKRLLYKTFLRMEIGKETSLALMVMVDVFFPEKISIGSNSVIGYNTTILTHEYLIKEYRIGRVTIGDRVMIGANSTILPGVTIGSDAVIGAGTVVSKDVARGQFVAGNPMQIIK